MVIGRRTQQAAKRALDVAVASGAIALLSPLLAATALLIRLAMGSPVLFRQTRLGYMGRVFILYKFRTMSDARDTEGYLLPDEQRLTRTGRTLRRTSLDELPQLLNVLRGDMSLVGPRPLLSKYASRYSQFQMRRHEVRPGITGWAQVNGRNALTWEQKFALDVWYVDHISLLLDLQIIALTVLKTFRREGITQPGRDTADEFKGTIDTLPD